MKYAGTVNVIDDNGEIVYERELTSDEIIEELISDKKIVIIGVSASATEIPAILPKREYKKKDPVMDPAPPKQKHQKTCSYCDLPGHMAKTCPKKRVDDRASTNDEPLTESEFDDVKQAKKDGLTTLDCAHELKIPLIEVNRAYPAADYDYYFEHREQ